MKEFNEVSPDTIQFSQNHDTNAPFGRALIHLGKYLGRRTVDGGIDSILSIL